VNRSVRDPPACFRCLFERVGKCPIEAGVIVVEKNVLDGVNLGLLAVVLLLFLLTYGLCSWLGRSPSVGYPILWAPLIGSCRGRW
jgi:hypothetical protein